MRRLTAAACAVLLAGCAYYNGLYNANRLADEARKAEREGRTGEARSLWSRAAVKAESVSTRFPGSRWRDDALLLWGRALFQIDACSRAVQPLAIAGDSSTDGRIAAEARLLEAECRLAMREPDSAVVAVNPIADSAGPRRARALVLRARAHLAAGRADDALRDAEAAGGRAAAFPRATALAQLERPAEARAVLDSLVAGPFVERAWADVLTALGRADPDAAGDLATRLAAREDVGTGARARLLVADGERWLAAGRRQRAESPFRQALALAPDSVEGRVAEAHLLMGALLVAEDPAAVPQLLTDIRRVTAPGGRPVQIAGRGLNLLPRVIQAQQEGHDPALLFLAAEAVRDSLGAAPLAAQLFLRTARQAGDDVLAPKAILAVLALGLGPLDSLRDVLANRYPTSVYTLALRGEAGERYRAVEDSLRQVFAGLRAESETRPARGATPRNRNE